LQIKVKKLTPTATIPTRATSGSAGYDLYADIAEPVVIHPGETKKIGTGVAITPPDGTFGAIFARSGLATKKGLRPSNCVGVADIDYTGEYIVALHNDSQRLQTIEPKERIAQLVFIPCVVGEFLEVENLDDTDRGEGGFGSTGK
jgi:dUTP pyrophosphatase